MTPQKLISKYIQNTLTPEEQLEFNTLLDTDIVFKKEVTFHSNLKKVTEDKDDDNFRALLSDIEAKGSESIDIEKPVTAKWWYIAASIIAIIGLTYFFVNESPASNKELFAEYFEPYRNITQPVVRSDAQESIKEAAFNAYENAKFEEALYLFNQVLLNKEETSILFYKANTLLTLNESKKAIAILEQDIHLTDIFSEKRYWYLALAYLKNDQPEVSKEFLEKLIAIPNSEYKKIEAQKLLKQLK